MAFDLKIVAYPPGKTEIEVEPSWWSMDDLLNKHDFSQEIDHGYLDYYLHVNKSELKAIAKDQEKNLDKGIYSWPEWKRINSRKKEELNSLLDSITNDCPIKILIYEWESGLD